VMSLSLYSVVLLVFGMPVYKMCKDQTIKQIIKNRLKLYLTVCIAFAAVSQSCRIETAPIVCIISRL